MVLVAVTTWNRQVYKHGIPFDGSRHASATNNADMAYHTCRCGMRFSDLRWPENWFEHKACHIDVPVSA